MNGQGGGGAGAGWASDVPTVKQAPTVPVAVKGSLLILGCQCLLRLQKDCRVLLPGACMTPPIRPMHLAHQCVCMLDASTPWFAMQYDIVARYLSYYKLNMLLVSTIIIIECGYTNMQ